MSRIGKKPITVPNGVKISLNPSTRTITVEGAKGKLSYVWRPEVIVTWDEAEKRIVCTISEEQKNVRQTRAYWGTVRARINNLIDGVTKGFVKKLEINGVGWNAKDMGKMIQLNIGYCHPVDLPKPEGVDALIEKNLITISGADKQAVGQYAAVIRSKRPPEPYNGKGIKYIDEIIIRKQGKVFGA